MLTRAGLFSPSKIMVFLFALLGASALGALVFGAGYDGIILFLGVFLGGLIISIGIFRPHIPFYILIASFGLGHILRTDLLSTTFLIIPGALAIISWLFHTIIFRVRIRVYWPTSWPWFFFGIWALVVTYLYNALDDFRPYLLVLILYFLTFNVLRSPRHLIGLAWTIVLSLTGSSFVVIYERVLLILELGGFITATQLHAASLALGDKNIVSMQIMVAIPFIFALLSVVRSKFTRFLLLFSLLSILSAIFFLASLGALTGLVVLLVCAFWLEKKQERRIALLVFFFILAIAAIFSPFSERIRNKISPNASEDLLSSRGMIWVATVKMISERPWWGYGSYTNLNIAYMGSEEIEPWLKSYVTSRKDELQAHNIFLTILSQFGIPGFVFFTIGFGLLYWLLWKIVSRLSDSSHTWLLFFSRALFVALLATLAQAMALTVPVDKHFWAMLGTIPALAYILKSRTVA